MTADDLKKVCPTVKNAETWAELFSTKLDEYKINTTNRRAMFIAQTLHETGGYKFLHEIWGPTQWQEKYEGSKELGNTEPGDGEKYKGRGLIQCTGRVNYTAFAVWANDMTIVDSPEKLEEPEYALLSAIWFWTKHNLNEIADDDNIDKCTRIINGPGMLGHEERKKYYELGQQVF